LLNFQKIANNNGITWDSVKTGKYADSQTSSRPKSPEELAVYQTSVNRIYNLFLNKVAQGRKLPQSKVAEIAQGRVWSGTAAKEIGLVDEIGGLDAAISYAATQAKLGDNWEAQEFPKAGTLGERLFGKTPEEVKNLKLKSPDLLPSELQQLQQEIKTIQSFNDPKDMYARLNFNLDIK
jgi:protease IV